MNIQENCMFLYNFQITPNRQRKHTYFKFTVYRQQFNPGTDLFQNNFSQMNQKLNEHIKNWVTAIFQSFVCFAECTMFDNSIWRILGGGGVCGCVHARMHVYLFLQMFKRMNFKDQKNHFGPQFRRCESTVDWLLCFGPMAVHRSIGKRKLLMSFRYLAVI